MAEGPSDEHQRRLEAAIMRLLLIEHPSPLTVGELARELAELAGSELAVDDAIARLERAGLVHSHGAATFLSRAARYFDRLRIY